MSEAEDDPQVLLDLVQAQLATQLAFVDAVDTKLGLFLSVGSGLLGILAAVLALRTHPQAGAGIWTLGAAGIAYLVLAAASGSGLASRSWDLGPEPREVEPDIGRVPLHAVKWGMTARFNEAYEANQAALERKNMLLYVSLGALVIETVALAAGLSLLAF